MISLNVELTTESLIIFGFLQLLLIFVIGRLFCLGLEIYYRYFTSSHQVFKQKNYTPKSEAFSQKYCFVAVEYNSSDELQGETFYTLMSDWTHLDYSNNRRYISSSVFFSNILLGLFPVIGFFLLAIANLQDMATSPELIAKLTHDTQMLRNYGGLLCISTLLSASIKLIFDFTYTKLY